MVVFVPYYFRNYWCGVGAKFDDCSTKLVDFVTKYNAEIIKYRPFMTKYTPPAARSTAEGCVCSLMVYI